MAAAEVVLEVVPKPPPPREPAAAQRDLTVKKVVMYMCLASAWVGCACTAGTVIARRALGADAPVTWALIKASIGSFVFPALVAVVFTLRLLRAMCAAGFGSSLPTSSKEIQIRSRKMFGGLNWKVLRHPAVLSAVLVALVDFLFLLLLGAGVLVFVGLLPVEESRREKIGYALFDTGVLGIMTICCFVGIPSYALTVWRSK